MAQTMAADRAAGRMVVARKSRVAALVPVWRAATRFTRFLEVGGWPWLDLAIRLELAIWGAARGFTESALRPPFDSLAGDVLAAGILLAALLLLLGLGTRLAAMAMLALALMTAPSPVGDWLQIANPILFGWYVIMGAGPISLDQLLYRGVADMALPFATPLDRICALITHVVGPVYRLAIRGAAAWVLLGADLLAMAPGQFSPSTVGEAALAILLLAGLFTRAATLPPIALALSAQASGIGQGAFIDWALVLGIILFRGPGPLSLDHPLAAKMARVCRDHVAALRTAVGGLPQVVIVGAGFAGLAAARRLADARCRITLIDRRNYHLFQPLLYQVATSTLSPADIAVPIRELFRDQDNIRVRLGRVSDVDTNGRAVLIGDDRITYDYLILATGARHNYFGNDHWEPFAPGLKKIDDATKVRRRLLLAFERAENSDNPAQQAAYLTFVIVGGGPTGVELAGAIGELAHHGMAGEFRNIDPRSARIILLEGGPRVLATFPESLSAMAARSLQQLGVEVRTKAIAERIDRSGVTVGGAHIPARTVLWAAGVIASPAGKWLKAAVDPVGRVKMNADLSVPGHREIFVVGDTAYSESWAGKPMPGLAPAAKQSGAYAALVIKKRLEGKPAPPPFRYRHRGSLATIGRKAAVADLRWIRLAGVLAWWFWGAMHIFFLTGARNRLAVAIEWFWAYLTFRRSTRLITGGEE